MFVQHRFGGPLIKGTLLKRRMRFLTDVRLDDGTIVVSHLADRGRLIGIMEPGAEVWLANTKSPTRKTAFTTVLASSDGVLVSVDPAGANQSPG